MPRHIEKLGVVRRVYSDISGMLTQSAKRHLKDALKMPYEDTQDIPARRLLDA